MRAFDKAWQILKEDNTIQRFVRPTGSENVGEKYGLPTGFTGNPEMYNRAREEDSYNRVMDVESMYGENEAMRNVGESPSFRELVDKLTRGEKLTRDEQMMLQRF